MAERLHLTCEDHRGGNQLVVLVEHLHGDGVVLERLDYPTAWNID